MPDLDPEAVVAAGPFAPYGDGPHPGRGVPLHRQHLRLVAGRAGQLQRDRAGGRRPDRDRRLLLVDDHAEAGVGGGLVQVVEDARELDRGQDRDPAGCVAARHQHLAEQQLAEGGVGELGHGEGAVGAQVREAAALRPEQPAGAGRERESHRVLAGQPAAVRRRDQGELGGKAGEVRRQGHRGAVDEDGEGSRRVELGSERAHAGQHGRGIAGEQPRLAGGRQVEALVVGQVLDVAAVHHEAQPDGVRAQRHPEHGAEGVEADRPERRAPVGLSVRALPGVQAPPGVVAVGAAVVDDGGALVRRRFGGEARRRGARVDLGVAGAQPDLGGDRRVDVPVLRHVLGAGVVDHQEAHLAGRVGDPHPGEAAVGVLAGERVAAGEAGDRARRDVAPRVQRPVPVALVLAAVVHDQPLRPARSGGRGRWGDLDRGHRDMIPPGRADFGAPVPGLH
nr:hypothetical protein GCM10020092_083850 [Actinoplanes digitatis]